MRHTARFALVSVLLVVGNSTNAAQVTLVGSDPLNQTSFNTGLHWSNGLAPSIAHTYVVSGHTLRTPPGGGNRTFAGSSLTISNGGTLAFKGFNGNVITVNNLVLNGGGIGNWAGGVQTFTLAGNGITLGGGGVSFNTVELERGIIVAAPISGSGNASIRDGNVQLSAANSYDGFTFILNHTTGATLQLNNINAVQNSTVVLNPNTVTPNLNTALIFGSGLGTFNLGGLAGNGRVNLRDMADSAVNLQVGKNGQATSFDGVLSGSGSLTKVGTGALTLSGASTYTGGTEVNSGTLAVNGSILGHVTVHAGATLRGSGSIGGSVTSVAGSTVAPGALSPGALHINGDYTQQVGSQLRIELGGNAPGTSYDQMIVAGTATFAGTLDVSLTNGFSPLLGSSFKILNWGSISGAFNTINLPALAEVDWVWNTSRLYSDGILSVDPYGDYNRNGIVDAVDYVIWRLELGHVVQPCSGADSNCNGFVEWIEYETWRENYGRTFSSTGAASGYSATAALVPEPSSLALLSGIILGTICRNFNCREHRCRAGSTDCRLKVCCCFLDVARPIIGALVPEASTK